MKILYFILLLLIPGEEEEYNPTTFVFPAYKHTYGIRKAGATELFLFMGFRVKFRDPQGLACTRLDAWEDPEDPHDDDELTVYGVNSGQNNIIYNKSMWGLDVYGLYEDDEQLLNRPHGICANSRGDVYVADTGNNRIVRLFNPAHKLEFVEAIGSKGSSEGQFLSPRQIALDNSGTLFVSDSGNHRIQVFDSTNSFRYSFSGNNYLSGPNGIAVTDSLERNSRLKDNFIIIIDSLNSRINKFSLSGDYIKSISMNELGFNRTKLEYVCLDYHNQILVTDSRNHCIHKFTRDLNYIISFGREGDEDHEFISPKGIAIYRRFGQLFIAEESGAQYYWVGTDIFDITLHQQEKNVTLSFRVTEPSNVIVDVLDEDDKFLTRLTYKRRLGHPGIHHLSWNGIIGRTHTKVIENEELELSEKAIPRQLVLPGRYKFKISLEATYSSRTHFIRSEVEEFDYTY